MIFITLGLVVLLLGLAAADGYSTVRARGYSHTDVADLPWCEFGLILGTSKYLADGHSVNHYYQYRIDAALELWQAGKVKALLASGSGVDYHPSETACMQADLVAAGVPESAIWQDPAGFRTIDSILRYRQKFGSHSVCLISQPFHNQRALVQAQYYRLNVCAYNAHVIGVKAGWKIHARERLARIRLWYDLLWHVQAAHSLAQTDIVQLPTEPGA